MELSLPGGTFPHQKSMAGCETLLLLDLHRAVKFHYEMRQHVDRYLGQDIFNSVLMGVRCHPAHRDILCAAEGSSSGQMKTWSCSFSVPDAAVVLVDPRLESRGSAGNGLRQLGHSGNGGQTLEFLSTFLWRAPPLEMRRERREFFPDHAGK